MGNALQEQWGVCVCLLEVRLVELGRRDAERFFFPPKFLCGLCAPLCLGVLECARDCSFCVAGVLGCAWVCLGVLGVCLGCAQVCL